MDKKLAMGTIIKDGLDIGLKNAVPILVNVLLFVLTVWIPYLNIGTIIGLIVGIPAKASRGEAISMTEIFDPKYRKSKSEFFLTYGLVSVGVFAGCVFFLIPGCIIGIAWSLALLLAVDKGKASLEAISISNKVTYGNKGAIFLAELVLFVVAGILGAVFMMIPFVGWLLYLAVVIFTMFVSIGMQAYIYKTLCADE